MENRRSLSKYLFRGSILTLTLIFLLLNLLAWSQASNLVTHPMDERPPVTMQSLPEELPFQDVLVNANDGLALHGWYLPSENGAIILMQHGYKSDREEFVEEATMFGRAGYGVLVTSVRAHDVNDGDQITFGLREMQDIDAWVSFALLQPGIDPERIGMIGNSLGASMTIQYAANHDAIKAIVAHSAFSSMRDTIETSIRHFTGLPPFPFAPLIQFWAEIQLGFSINEINASAWIADISPRPVFLLHSLDDTVISPGSGQLLYEAAREPKEIWLENGVDHADFEQAFPEKFADRVIGFFNRQFFPEGRPLKE